jgi:glutamyl-tRNA reductase
VNTVCVGISHQTAPAELRALLQFSPEETRAALPRIRALGFSECALMSSVDRTEIYAAGAGHEPSVDALVKYLSSEKAGDHPLQPTSFFTLKGSDAAEHLLRAAAGLDSMIIGDMSAFPAIREAWLIAQEAGTIGFLLEQFLSTAEIVHERARTQTLIAEGSVSVSAAAVELAQRIFDDLTQRRGLIIGAGETAQTTAKLLRTEGIGSLTIAHKNQERASQLAASVAGTTAPFETLQDFLPTIDIVIASLQSEQHLLTSRDIKAVQKHRHGRTLFLIDCGVPHNIDPFAGELENVFLYDLDTLNLMVNENIARRRAHAPDVESIVRDELKRLVTWHSSLESSPTIEALSSVIEKIRQDEIAGHKHHFSPQDRKAVEELTKRITDRIVQIPARHLTTGHGKGLLDRLQNVILVRKLFGLDARENDSSESD